MREHDLVHEHAFDIRIDFHQRLVFDPMPGGGERHAAVGSQPDHTLFRCYALM